MHNAQSATLANILLLNKYFTTSDAQTPNTIKTIALNPGGVDATVSIKTPTIRPDIAAVSSEQNIHIVTSNASGNIGLARDILIVNTPLYCIKSKAINISVFTSRSFKMFFRFFIGLFTTLGFYATLAIKGCNYHNRTNFT